MLYHTVYNEMYMTLDMISWCSLCARTTHYDLTIFMPSLVAWGCLTAVCAVLDQCIAAVRLLVALAGSCSVFHPLFMNCIAL
jgi:hypothetical protein